MPVKQQDQNSRLAQKKGLFQKAGACFTGKFQTYQTPKWLYDQLDAEFHFVLDPATSSDNPLGTKYFYSNEENGLGKSWDLGGNVFINPPYHSKNIISWMEKAHETTLAAEDITVVMLLPARTDVRWFHHYVWDQNKPRDNIEVRFLKGRVRFEINGQLSDPAPFPSMVIIFKPSHTNTSRAANDKQDFEIIKKRQILARNEAAERQLTLFEMGNATPGNVC